MVFLAPPLLLLEQSTSSWHGINALPCKVTTSDERQALRVNLLSGAPVVQATPDRSEKTEALGGKSPARLYRRPQSQDMPFCGPLGLIPAWPHNCGETKDAMAHHKGLAPA